MTPNPFRIPLSAPALLGREREYLAQAVDQNQLSSGEFVTRFEAAFAAYVGARHAITCSSGTTALHLALLALDIQPGDRINVTPLTYVATVAAIRYCGAIPVFFDVSPSTWNVAAAADSFARATIVVSLYGMPVREAHCGDQPVIHDAAESLGASRSGQPALFTTYSFYGNKVLTTGEGGMVTTDSTSLAAELRLFRGQGQDPQRRYWHTRVGMNYRMPELSAAIGLAQLERLDQMLAVRHQRLAEYHTLLTGSGTEWQIAPAGTVQAPWVAACLLPAGTNRDQIMQQLAMAGIETRPAFPLVSDMPPYVQFAKDQQFPVARAVSERGILLPLHARLGTAEVMTVCTALRRLL